MGEKIKKFRYIIFLKDTFLLALSAFGGPQAHISHMFKLMVDKRRYVNEEELIELNALCQILPGPTSTQTITAIGYKIGGTKLAFLTLLIWILPAGAAMIFFSIYLTILKGEGISLGFTKFIQPMALVFIFFSGLKLSQKVLKTKTAVILFIISIFVSIAATYLLGDKKIGAIIFPVFLMVGGIITSTLKFRRQKRERNKKALKIDWTFFIWFVAIFVVAISLGNIFSNKFVLLFENFYRNGSLIFGGGQVLIPLLKTEFVALKGYLTNEEFLSGFGFVQGMPGPVFSFTGYIGGLSVQDQGVMAQIAAGTISLIAVFLPGTLLIFFVIKFWEELKQYRFVRASLEGISAVASGMVIAAVVTLLFSLNIETGEFTTSVNVSIFETNGLINIGVMISTFLLLKWDKIPAPFLILAGLIAGIIFPL
jgi:chromate transporter